LALPFLDRNARHLRTGAGVPIFDDRMGDGMSEASGSERRGSGPGLDAKDCQAAARRSNAAANQGRGDQADADDGADGGDADLSAKLDGGEVVDGRPGSPG
jgi:hypothetical protein